MGKELVWVLGGLPWNGGGGRFGKSWGPGEVPPRGCGPVEAGCWEPGLFLPGAADWSPRSRGTGNRLSAAGEDESLRHCE